MGLPKAMLVVLVSGGICVMAFSCRVAGPHMTPEQADTLSREEIIERANAAAAERSGYAPADCNIYYDEGNFVWGEEFFTNPEIRNGVAVWPKGKAKKRMHEEGVQRTWPHLVGRDYQVVVYKSADPRVLDDGLWVLVDRQTGEVLLVYPELRERRPTDSRGEK